MADALATIRRPDAGGLRILRADSAYYNHDGVPAAHRGGARFSITAQMNPAVAKAIASIDESAWVPIHCPNAIFDEDEQRWVSDAESPKSGRPGGFTGSVPGDVLPRWKRSARP